MTAAEERCDAMAKSRVVDSHHHFVDPDRFEYPWMTGPKVALKKRFMPEEFRPTLAETGVDATVLVQTRVPMDETREWLALAAETDFVAGVVGWVDLKSPTVAGDLSELLHRSDGRYLVGVRHKLHDEPDPNWILRDDVQRGVAAVLQPLATGCGVVGDKRRIEPGLLDRLGHLADPVMRQESAFANIV